MKAFHNAYAALTNKLEGKSLTELLNLKGLFKPYGLGEPLNPQKNIYKVWVTEGDDCQVVGILIATRFGNIVIHQKYADNDSLIVIKNSSEKLNYFLLLEDETDILSSEQVLRLVGSTPVTIKNENPFVKPNASRFIDLFTLYSKETQHLPLRSRRINLEDGKRYVDRAGNVVEIAQKIILRQISIFKSKAGDEYFPDGSYATGCNSMSVLNIALEI